MGARLTSLLIWAVVAATAVAWGLRLSARPLAVPGHASTAGPAPAAGADLSRLLGNAPPEPVAVEATVPADARFKLLGVVAPREGQVGSGLALISVDGRPARAVAVGHELEPGLTVRRVDHRRVELGRGDGGASVALELPALAEASRGRPADGGAVPVQPVPPPVVMPGQPAPAAVAQPGGRTAGLGFGNAAPLVPLQQVMPAGARGTAAQAGVPGAPVQPDSAPQPDPGHGAQLPTR